MTVFPVTAARFSTPVQRRPLVLSLFLLALVVSPVIAARQVVVIVDPNDPCRACAYEEVLPQLDTLSLGDGIKVWDSSSPRAIFSQPRFRRRPLLDLEPVFAARLKVEAGAAPGRVPSGIPEAEAIFSTQLAAKYYAAARRQPLPGVDLVFVSSPLFIYAEGLRMAKYATVDGAVPNAGAFGPDSPFPLRLKGNLAEGIDRSDWGLKAAWIYPESILEAEAAAVLKAIGDNAEDGAGAADLALGDIRNWLRRELGKMWATYLGQFGIRLVHFGSAPVMPWQESAPIDPWSAEEIATTAPEVIRYGDDRRMEAEPEPTDFAHVFLDSPWKMGSSTAVEKVLAAGRIESPIDAYVVQNEGLCDLAKRSRALVCLGVASKAGSREANERLARDRARNLGLAIRRKLNFTKPIYGQSLGQYVGNQEDQQYQRGLIVIGLTSGEEDIVANPLLLQKALAEWEAYPVDRAEYTQAELFPLGE